MQLAGMLPIAFQFAVGRVLEGGCDVGAGDLVEVGNDPIPEPGVLHIHPTTRPATTASGDRA